MKAALYLYSENSMLSIHVWKINSCTCMQSYIHMYQFLSGHFVNTVQLYMYVPCVNFWLCFFGSCAVIFVLEQYSSMSIAMIFYVIQHLRSLMIDNSDIVGERRSKWYQREGFRFYFQRADGRYIFKVSDRIFVLYMKWCESVRHIQLKYPCFSVTMLNSAHSGLNICSKQLR